MRPAVDRGGDAVPGNFLHFRDAGRVGLPAIGCQQGLGNGVFGVAFGQRRVLQQLLFGNRAGVQGGDAERALGERAGLVKHDRFRPGERLEIGRAFDEYAAARSAADAAEKTERNRDDERARDRR